MSNKKKVKRQLSSYLKGAKSNKDLVPSLKKYSRRKSLNRWEKAAITRAEKKVKKNGGRDHLFPLTKTQLKTLKDKDIVVKNGIQAIRLTNIAANSSIKIDHGELKVISGGRKFDYISADANLPSIIEAAQKQFDKGKRTIYLWTKNGRSARGFRSMAKLMEKLGESFNAYTQTEQWIFGIAAL